MTDQYSTIDDWDVGPSGLYSLGTGSTLNLQNSKCSSTPFDGSISVRSYSVDAMFNQNMGPDRRLQYLVLSAKVRTVTKTILGSGGFGDYTPINQQDVIDTLAAMLGHISSATNTNVVGQCPDI